MMMVRNSVEFKVMNDLGREQRNLCSVSGAGGGNVAWGLTAVGDVVDCKGTDSVEDIVHVAVVNTAVKVAH